MRRIDELKPVNILQVMPDLDPATGGPVVAVRGLSTALARAGATVRILATDHGFPRHGFDPAIEVGAHACRWCAWRWSPALGRSLRQAVKWADLVQIHTLWTYPVAAAAREARRQGVPYVMRPCGMLDPWALAQKRWKKRIAAALFERRNLDCAAALWFTSEAEAELARPFGCRAPARFLPLGLEREEYKELPRPGTFRAQHPELARDPYLLFLGRLHPKKRPDLAIRALARLRQRNPGLRLVLIGSGAPGYVAELRELSRGLDVAGAVMLLGELRGPAARAAMVDAELFVLPSHQENFGIAVVEAMACGIPVVVSDRVNIVREIEAAGAGRASPVEEPALTEVLQSLLADQSLRSAMGARGRDLVLQRFTWDRIVSRVLQVYEQILAGADPRRPSSILHH